MSTLEIAVTPLDVVRQTTLRLLARSTLLTRVLGRRRSRVASLATAQVLVIATLAILFPVGMFFIGPMILGAAHIAADARYLVIRQRLPRGFVILSATSAIAIVGLRALQTLGVIDFAVDAIEAGMGAVWMIAALVFAGRIDRTARRRAIGVGSVLSVFFVLGIFFPRAANVGMVHIHNVVGIAAWALLYKKRKAWELLPILALAIAVVFILSGAALPYSYRLGGETAFGTHVVAIGRFLAPGASPHFAASVVITFVLLQAVHYAVWVTWIPQEDLKGEGTPTFRMTARGLVADFGVIGCALVAIVVIGLAGFSLFRMHDALHWYVLLSRFHGLLELAVIAFLVVRGKDLARNMA